MAARYPEDMGTPSQPELMRIAREIPANKIYLLAIGYLDIEDPLFTQIESDAKYEPVQTSFKCLLHWSRNTEVTNPRKTLYDILQKAVKDGYISQKGVDILKNQSQGEFAGNCPFHVNR